MEEDNRELIYPSVEWMRKKYNQFNDDIFDGRLGECSFGLLTRGKGSQGGRLGEFELQNKSLKVDINSRKIYIPYGFYSSDLLYITNNNFVDKCNPIIRLNGHYQATEEAWENTLVHEMCHYYQYMYGKCPKQAHGPEFRSIASYVSVNSAGRFTIQRLATAEQMKSFKLDSDMQAKRDKRIENKKSNAIAVFVFRRDGKVELTILSRNNVRVLREIYEYYSNPKRESIVLKMITSVDPRLIQLLFDNGYKKIMRTWRLWDVRNKSFVRDIDSYDTEDWINNLKENFNIMGKRRLNEENMMNIIKEAINEYIDGIGDNEEDNSIKIGGLDLGAMSPFEMINN